MRTRAHPLEALGSAALKDGVLHFSIPSDTNVATGLNVNVEDVNFELKSSLVNMVRPNEDANAIVVKTICEICFACNLCLCLSHREMSARAGGVTVGCRIARAPRVQDFRYVYINMLDCTLY